MSTIREKFEAWAESEGRTISQWPSGEYEDSLLNSQWDAVQAVAATEAAKATGMAGELPPLPDPHPITEWDSKGRAYDFDQMRAYGQACAEAARQPAPVVLSDEQIIEFANPHLADHAGYWKGHFKTTEVIAFARSVIAATRSQP